MIRKLLGAVVLCLPALALCQQDSVVLSESPALDLQFLIVEALMNNPEIKADLYKMDVMQAKIPQASSLDYPELKFLQEAMPDFRFNQAMYSRFELMQTIPFPTKLGAREELARIQAEHAHHDHLEKINDILSRLKTAFYELWFVQQNTLLDRENLRLMNQFVTVARTKYGVGQTSQQDVLKGQVEVSMLSNNLISLRQRELSTKAMLMSILNRSSKDTVGFAVIPEEIIFEVKLDTLITLALQSRPMIIHDSLSINEQKTALSIAQQQYLPDFKFGLEHLTSPIDGFNGWSVSAAITIPVAPWTLGKTSAGVDEANVAILRARSSYAATRNMVISAVKDLYYKADGGKRQLATYRVAILPQARQSLNASLTAYQTGTADFLMLIDAYRTYVNLTKEYFMIRMQFEQNIAELEREVGYQNIRGLK